MRSADAGGQIIVDIARARGRLGLAENLAQDGSSPLGGVVAAPRNTNMTIVEAAGDLAQGGSRQTLLHRHRGSRLGVRLGVTHARLQVLADVAPNQQWDEGADLGVGERGCHGGQAFVYYVRVEPVVEVLVDTVGDVLQV
jgi:hypothetical protein